MDLLILGLMNTAIFLFLVYYWQAKPKNYPKGPIGIPILGHIPFFGSHTAKTFMKWREKYGPVFAISFGAFPTVVINDHEVIKTTLKMMELSGRPNMQAFCDRSGIKNGSKRYGVLFSDEKDWIEQRKFTVKNLKDLGVGKRSMEYVIHQEITELIKNMKTEIGKPFSTRNRYTVAVLNIVLNYLTSSRHQHDDPKLTELLNHVTTNVEKYDGFSSLGLFYPWLARNFPKLIGYAEMNKDMDRLIKFIQEPIDYHKNTMGERTTKDFIDLYLEKIELTKNPESSFYKENGAISLRTTLIDLFVAGSETTSTTLSWACLYLSLNQDIQKKLQDEIDYFIGFSRLPTLEDMPKMPYTEAVISETLRLASIVPLGLFRNVLKEINILDYKIPKDTMAIYNIYGCHYDVKYWGDPEVFRPERFLSEDGKTVLTHEAFIPFSTGNRNCIGKLLANFQLFLFVTSLFQKFSFHVHPDYPDATIEPITSWTLLPKPHYLLLKERF